MNPKSENLAKPIHSLGFFFPQIFFFWRESNTEVLMVGFYFKTNFKKLFHNEKWKLGQYVSNPAAKVRVNTEIAQIRGQRQS